MELTRQGERDRYNHLYDVTKDYVCKGIRLPATKRDLLSLPCRGSYLDVGCGKGQMLEYAREIGFSPTVGVDHAALKLSLFSVAGVHALPFRDKSFDVAVCFDVLEHLIPGDDELCCRELARVARKHVLVSASNAKSVYDGWDLHINKRDYGVWQNLLKLWFPGAINTMPGEHSSPMWRVDL